MLDVELNAKTILTELRGLLSGNTAEFGQFLIQKSKEWNIPAKQLLGEFEKLGAEFSGKKNTSKELYAAVKKYIDNPAKIPEYAKTLSSEDSEKLADIIVKYIDLDTVGEMTGNDFGYGLFSKMDESEIVTISRILNVDISLSPLDFIEQCVKSMIKNNLLGLLASYKQAGLDKQ